MLIPSFTSSANVLKGDDFFQDKQYEKARQEYSRAAEIGSPHAYYQLGTMSLKGIGQEKDYQQAILWFALAADADFGDAKIVLEQIFQQLDPEQLTVQTKNVQNILQQYCKEQIQALYFPEILTSKLKTKIEFNNGQVSEFNESDIVGADLQLSLSQFEDDLSDYLGDEFADQGEPFASNEPDPIINPLRNRPYLLVADYDIADDGSIRNISTIQTIGSTKIAEDGLLQQNASLPTFDGEPVAFVGRTSLGMAALNKFDFVEQHSYIYGRIKRVVNRNKASTERKAQFQYAMALKIFPWLPQKDDEANKILLETAKREYPQAQYELGLSLYRDQKDIPQAVEWIGKAAQFGLPKAQYLLAKLLISSPWIKKDELKALHWFELAAEQNYYSAVLEAAKLRLTIENGAFRDLKVTQNLLDSVKNKSVNNPTYYYLRALTFRHKDNRDLRQAFNFMRQAITVAERYNWDTSEWYDELSRWMGGSIRVTDLETVTPSEDLE